MTDYAPLLERAFSLEPRELSYVIEDIEGDVPSFIEGAYYVNGPARFARAGLRYRHWLDGDGMVCALRFTPGEVRFTNRYVRSHKYVEEEKAGHPIFRTFGTAFESDAMKRGIALESPANVSVYPVGGALLAFGEQGLPWELDPETLETRAPYRFHGRLNEVSPFSAHPKIDPQTGEMFNFGVSFSATQPQLNVYRFDARAQLIYRKRHRLDYPCSVHDFSLSPNFAVWHLSPYLLQMERMLSDGQTLMDALQWTPERGCSLFLVSRDSGEAVASIPIEVGYSLHLINCFETDEQLMIDVIEYGQPIYDQYQIVPNLFNDVREARPTRYVIDLATHALVEKRSLAPLLSPDFPALDARRATQAYDEFWMLGMGAPRQAGRKFFNQLLHINWSEEQPQVYQAPANCYLGGEPVYIGSPQEPERGAVLCQLFDAERLRSAFALFDAHDISRGPVAMLGLREPIPLLFHATFQSM